MNVAEFIAKWRRVDLKERSAAQEHFLDLCRLVGHPTPAEADPTGADFCFEKGVAKARSAGVTPALKAAGWGDPTWRIAESWKGAIAVAQGNNQCRWT